MIWHSSEYLSTEPYVFRIKDLNGLARSTSSVDFNGMLLNFSEVQCVGCPDTYDIIAACRCVVILRSQIRYLIDCEGDSKLPLRMAAAYILRGVLCRVSILWRRLWLRSIGIGSSAAPSVNLAHELGSRATPQSASVKEHFIRLNPQDAPRYTIARHRGSIVRCHWRTWPNHSRTSSAKVGETDPLSYTSVSKAKSLATEKRCHNRWLQRIMP